MSVILSNEYDYNIQMNDIIMIKKIMASICIVCLALGGCTEDRLLPDSGTSSTVEPVAVKLTLGIDDYNTSSDAETRAEEMPPVLRMYSPHMEVKLLTTPYTTTHRDTTTKHITKTNAALTS